MFSKLPEDRYGGPLHVGGTGTPLKVAPKPSQTNSSKKIFCCLQICVVWSGYTREFLQVMKKFDKKAEPCKLNEIKRPIFIKGKNDPCLNLEINY